MFDWKIQKKIQLNAYNKITYRNTEKTVQKMTNN